MKKPLENTRRRRAVVGWLTMTVVLLSCFLLVRPSPAAGQEQAARTQPRQAETKSSSTKFLRYQADPAGGGVLQTSIVRYANDRGQTVDLIGAVHIGDRAYYDLLNERFKQYDSLLYEMVKPRDADVRDRQAGGGLDLIHMLQKTMQTVLELDYQLEGIDYAAENFVHADMDLETFVRRQSERGEGFLQLILRQMLNDMTRPPDPENQPPSLLEIMDAFGAPDRARRLKLLFAKQLSNVDDMMEAFSGAEGEGSVILDERNEAALKVLDERLAAGEDKLGIFYGAAHLKGMEELLAKRGFRQAGEPEWLIAWDMTLDNSGRELMRQRVREAIVAEATGKGQAAVEGGGAGGAALRRELEAMRSELEALRKENEALREQVQVLRDQNAALRDKQ